MNKVFKVIWNHATQSWVAVSELASAKGKTKSKTSTLTALSVVVGSAMVAGSALAAVSTTMTSTPINQQAGATISGTKTGVFHLANGTTTVVKSDGSAAPTNVIVIGNRNDNVFDNQVLIGYNITSIAYGKAGDTVVGNRVQVGGGSNGNDSFSTAVGFGTQVAGPSVAIGVGARSDILDASGWNATKNAGVAIGAFALQGGNINGGTVIGGLASGDYHYATSIGALSGVTGSFEDKATGTAYSIQESSGNAFSNVIYSQTSVGYKAGARARRSVAIGNCATTGVAHTTLGTGSVAIGDQSQSFKDASVAIGQQAIAGGVNATEIAALKTEVTRLQGLLTTANGHLANATTNLTNNPSADNKYSVAAAQSAVERITLAIERAQNDLKRASVNNSTTTGAIAIGYSAHANNLYSMAVGGQAKAYAANSSAIGRSANVSGANASSALAIGHDARVIGDTAVNATAIGTASRIQHNATSAIAFGTNSNIFGNSSNSIAIGTNANISNTYRRSNGVYAIAENATALGSYSTASANKSTAVGSNNTVIGASSGALGSDNTVGLYSSSIDTSTYNGTRSFVVGSNNTVTLANDTMVFGNNVAVTQANRSGSVILGNDSSVPENVTAINSAKVGTLVYSGFAGNLGGTTTDGSSAVAADQGRFVSIGNSSTPRQLKYVAAGRIASDSTDAINGSQLYYLSDIVNNMGASVATVIGGNATLNANGTVANFSQPLNTTGLGDTASYTAPTTDAGNVADAITNLNNYVNAGWIVGNNTSTQVARISPNEQVNFLNGTATSAVATANGTGADIKYNVNVDNTTIAVNGTSNQLTVNTTTLTNNANGSVVTPVGNASNLVNASQVAAAINASGWNTTLSNGTNVTVNPGNAVNYVSGNGTAANVTVNDAGAVVVSYDVNTTTGTIETNGTVSVADNNAFLNASSVANLVNNAAFNVTTAKNDVFVTNQEGKANATVKAGGNITYTAGKNIAIKQDGSNFTFATEQNVTFTNANVTSTLAIGNASSTSSPVVNIKTENATTANVNNATTLPTAALNITSADGKPTQIKGVASSLNTSTVNVTPITDTTRTTEKLLDLGNTTNPLSEDVLNSVATVRDLTNLGWVVSANGNNYKDTVKNANEVKFNGVNGITVTGNTTDGIRNINISLNTTNITSNANGTSSVTNGDSYVNASTVSNAINASGWNTTTTDGKTLNVNPGDQVNYVNGNGTKANVTTTTVNGKDVVSVSYDVNSTTGTVIANGTATVVDGSAFLNASTVANLVNNAAFNVTTAKVDAFVTNQEGKANATVKAGETITYTAGKNIAIKQDGSNFTFATEQNVTFTNANVTSTLAIGNASSTSSPVVNIKTENATTANVNNATTLPTAALNITSADGKPTQIKGVASSLNTSTVNVTPITDTTRTTEKLLDLGNTTNPLSEDVLNSVATVRDLTNLGWVVSANGNNYKDTVKNANEVKFNGVNGITVTGNTTDGIRNINISLNTTNITSNANGTSSVTNGDSYVNASTVSNAINASGWNTKLSDGTTLNVNPGDQVNYVSGKGTTANVTKAKDANGNDVVSVSYNVNQTTGSLNPNGTAKVADGDSFLNASTVANLVNNAAFNVTTAKVDAFAENQEGKANAAVKAGGNITYTAGKNIAISQNGSNFTFSTTKDIEVDSVTANNRVQIGSGNTAVNLTTDLGALQVADKDGNATQITNVEAGTNIMAFNKEGDQLVKVGDKYYVVNPETNEVDYDQESTLATEEELDELAKAKPELKAYVSYAKAASGLADLDNSEQTNALTVADAQRLGWVVSASGNDYADSVTNANEVRFNGMNGVSVTGNTTEDGVRNVNISLNTTTLTSNANGTTTVTNGNNYVNGTTVADAINASGWNTKLSDGTTLNVNPGDQVNYVSGKGTTANVTKAKDANGNDVVSVSYNVNQTTGSLNPNGTAKVADGDSFLNASTVANLVNNAAFNVTTAKVDAFAENQEGKANAAVKAGGNITYTAGKNIAISQNGSNFTFSTTKDIEVDSVTANNRVQIGSGNTAVNLTTDLGALQVADKDGNATQITNVEAGTNIMAFNKEGDQLVKVGDKYYVVNPETNEVDYDQESTLATEEELDELAKAKPELKAYVSYAKAASGLADLDNSEQTNALTVADAQRLGWVVSASGNDYADSVTNANEVRFNGSNGISVTGETDEHGVRNINVSIAKGNVAGNTTTGVATGDTNYVTGDQVANAINNSGWKTTATKVFDEAGNEIVDANKATAVNPGDSVNYVDGNSTKANVVVTKAADGKETVNVSYDLVTEDHLTPVANNAKSVTKPTNIDAKGKDAATVNDVLNAGWNLQANDEAVDAVTHGNNVNFTSKDGSVKITAKSDGSTSSLDFAVNATSIVNQVAGTISYKDGKATTNGDGKRVATVGDVANTINNTGWLTNVTDAKGNVTTKVVTPNTQVNYVNGDGTKANVVANSTTGGLDVTFNVKSANPETLTVDGNGVKVNTGSITEATDVAGDANRGKVTVATGEGNKVATVQNVANAINSASWTVKVADTQEEITTSTANDEGSSVRAGNEITHVAGKNLKVKRDGRNVTYALANDVSVNTVTAQNSITVGAGNAATTVTTSSAQDGVTEVKLADAAGKATRITNVAAGVKDTDAVNVSQLRNSNAQINQNIAHLNNKVNRMGKDLRAGIAGSNAAAGLPQVYIPGKSMVAAAAGTFKGQSAVAVGYSRASDNGKVILKLQGNANTRGDVGGSVGVGYQW